MGKTQGICDSRHVRKTIRDGPDLTQNAKMTPKAGPRGQVALRAALVLGVAAALPGCTAIQESRGYITDPLLADVVQPGLDNQRSVEGALGRPTFESQFGAPTWYYVSSITGQRPFSRPKIRQHTVLAVRFDESGRVVQVERTGVEKITYLDPDGDKTPTLGRERGFLEDLFGNIGQVGGGGLPSGGGPGGP
jgi:outer membrane protein assembly factor BamE (lipoprotein component of BamABCDE complex)